MARMIPSYFLDETPPGEKQVFRKLHDSNNDWVVIHSLELSPWRNQYRTEMDFLVIIPSTGILCIEIKSHKNINFDGEKWEPDTIKKSPFTQALDARYSFGRKLRNLHPHLSRIPICHLCIFTHSSFNLGKLISIAAYELMDMRKFNALPDSESFCEDLKKRLIRGIEEDPFLKLIRYPIKEPDINIIENCCVPVRKFIPEKREEIEERKRVIDEKLTEQQKPVLNLAENNERIIVSGGAGTGKTLIALETAMRAAEKGKRVGLLCFNTHIGEWLSKEVAGKNNAPGLITGSMISVMAKLTGISIDTRKKGSSSYWSEELPAQIEEVITDPNKKVDTVFDYLVIDEAQDILSRSNLWNCLQHFLEGGINEGSFAVFGDFENQVIAGPESVQEMQKNLQEIKEGNTSFELTENCRNYKIVGETAVILAGISADTYSGYLRKGGSEWYNINFYDTDEEQLILLKNTLKEFIRKSYHPGEITILSPFKDEKNAAGRLGAGRHRTKPFRVGMNSSTGYCSVSAFKGMENRVIILTDTLLEDNDFDRSLFYTALTRTIEYVHVLCDSRSKVTIKKWLSNNL